LSISFIVPVIISLVDERLNDCKKTNNFQARWPRFSQGEWRVVKELKEVHFVCWISAFAETTQNNGFPSRKGEGIKIFLSQL
jgi:hypothetical protein